MHFQRIVQLSLLILRVKKGCLLNLNQIIQDSLLAIDNSYRNTATKIDAINHWNYLNKSSDPGTIKQNNKHFEGEQYSIIIKSDDLFESALKFVEKMLYNTVNDLHIITTGIVYSRPEA